MTDAESKILRTDAHNLIIEGKNEKSIIKDLGIHAERNKYTPYDPDKKKQDILHPPLEDTSTYKDVKKYTKEMLNVRMKNAANIEWTPMNNRRKVRRQNMIEKSRELLP